MTSELEPFAVLADRLQLDGDVRGELLALELAAALADSTDESRRLCNEASALRSQHDELAWPPALWDSQGLMRGGLLVASSGLPRRHRNLPTCVGPYSRDLISPVEYLGDHGVQDLFRLFETAKLRPDGLWEHRHAPNAWLLRPVELDLDRAIDLRSLGVIRPIRNPAALRQLHGLEQLDLHRSTMTADLLAVLPKLALRSLAVQVQSSSQLHDIFETCPLLEHLTLHHFDGPLPKVDGLAQLRSLALLPTNGPKEMTTRLPEGVSLPRLESLIVSSPSLADLERLAALRLRRLIVKYNPSYVNSGEADAIVEALAKLDTLEHLGVLWDRRYRADVAPLSRLTQLRSLELSGRLHGELHAPATLERLTLSRWGAAARIHGAVAEVHAGASDLSSLQGGLAPLQTLGLYGQENAVTWRSWTPDRFTSLETITLEHVEFRHTWVAWLRELPRLRTVVWPRLPIHQQRTAADALPHLQILGADAARLRQDWPAPTTFERLSPSNWPKYEPTSR